MITHFNTPRALLFILCFAAAALFAPMAPAQESAPAISKQTIVELDKAMKATAVGGSEARQRLALGRVIRDAQQLVENHKNDPGRFLVLEFLFRAHQRLISIDDDPEHRKALLDNRGGTLAEVICREDELAISAALERGDIQAAKDRIMTLAPPYDPAAVDEKGRKLKKPVHASAHLRARARVYAALKEYDKALADAEEIYSRQYAADSGTSQRTLELDEAEQFRDEIFKLREKT